MAIGKNKDLPLKDCPNCRGKGHKSCSCSNEYDLVKMGTSGCEKCYKSWNNDEWDGSYGFAHAGTIQCKRCSGTGKIKRV